MKYSFSVNAYDSDGDCYDRGIFIHLGGYTIIKFENLGELTEFSEMLSKSLEEIKEVLKFR